LPAQGPAREVLAQSSYVDAVCRIGACLADALDYAHQRGLVHLDIKPSNILLAVDGQPMLLDFHLAQASLAAGAHAPDWLGGTPAYMSPEQAAAMAAASRGQPLPAPVDGRADLYSLGVVLYEALSGERPALPTPASLHKLNPRVPLGLSDIVHKCLAPRPQQRYADGAALADDLHRHVCHQPLRGVSNRSIAERWRKWRRRRPHQLKLVAMFTAVLAAAIAVGVVLWDRWNTQLDQARAALAEGMAHEEGRRFSEAAASFRRGLDLLENQPLAADLAPELRARLSDVVLAQKEAERALAAADFQRLADALRFLHGADWQSLPNGAALAERCAALWRKRAELLDRLGPQAKNDLLDVVLLWTDVRLRLALPTEQEDVRRDALVVLGQAEELLGPSHVLYRQMELLAASLEKKEEAATAAAKAAARPPQTAWEHYIVGRQLLLSAGPDAAATLAHAAAALEESIRLQPHGLWPNYYFGQCAYRTGRHEEAIRAFSTCIGAAPEAAEWFACRALAHAALGNADLAVRDHAHARRLQPTAAGPLAAVHYNLAVAHSKSNPRIAREHLDLALRDDPRHVAARALLKRLGAE
jgi:tetratricopeptide (TPR) repeat protein